MPSQLNGKRSGGQVEGSFRPTALPPQRYGGRRRPLRPRQRRRTHHWRRAPSGRSPTVAPPARIPASKRAEPRARPMSHATAGKRSRASCRDLHHDLSSRGAAPFAARRGRIALALRLPSRFTRSGDRRRRRRQTRLAPVVITATREPRGDRPQHAPTSSSSTPTRSAARAPTRSRTCCAASPACRSSATAGRARARASSSAAPARTARVVLVDGVRVGSATLGQAEFEAFSLAQIDRIEVLRGPASSLYGADAVGGVIQIFTRRGEGAPRGDRGGRGRRLPLVPRRRSARAARSAPGTTRVSLGHEESAASRRSRPAISSASFNPDADGFKRDSGTLRLGLTPAPGHRHRRAACSRRRLNAQYDGDRAAVLRRSFARLSQSADHPGRLARLPRQADQRMDDDAAGLERASTT